MCGVGKRVDYLAKLFTGQRITAVSESELLSVESSGWSAAPEAIAVTSLSPESIATCEPCRNGKPPRGGRPRHHGRVGRIAAAIMRRTWHRHRLRSSRGLSVVALAATRPSRRRRRTSPRQRPAVHRKSRRESIPVLVVSSPKRCPRDYPPRETRGWFPQRLSPQRSVEILMSHGCLHGRPEEQARPRLSP